MRGKRTLLRFFGTVTMVLGTLWCLCGASSPQGCNSNQSFSVGPSKGQVTAAVVGVVAVAAVATVVLVEVHQAHHRVKGCVSSGPEGIQVTTDGDKPKTYLLDGNTKDVKEGSLVRFHGDRVKKAKDSTGEPTFRIQKIEKNYGSCAIAPKPVA